MLTANRIVRRGAGIFHGGDYGLRARAPSRLLPERHHTGGPGSSPSDGDVAAVRRQGKSTMHSQQAPIRHPDDTSTTVTALPARHLAPPTSRLSPRPVLYTKYPRISCEVCGSSSSGHGVVAAVSTAR